MADRLTCQSLGAPGIGVTSIDLVNGGAAVHAPATDVGRIKDFRILVAAECGFRAMVDGEAVTISTGTILLVNPGQELALAPQRKRTGPGTGGLIRLFVVPADIIPRLVNSLTMGKGQSVRFVRTTVDDPPIVALVVDIHDMLRDPVRQRRGEALFIGAITTLLRDYGEVDGRPAVAALQPSPVDPEAEAHRLLDPLPS